MHWAAAFYANHSLDGAMDAHWSENAKYCFFTEKCIVFKWCMILGELTISVRNGFQTNIERLKTFSSNTFHFSDLLKKASKL